MMAADAPKSKQQREQFMIMGLLAVFGVVLMRALGSGRGGGVPPMPFPVPDSHGMASMGSAMGSAAAATPAGLSTYEYTADEVRDPMASLLPKPVAQVAAPMDPGMAGQPQVPVKPAEPPRVQIEGVIWGGLKPQVIIEGRIYTVGDRLKDGAQITRISQDGVEVLVDDTTFSLMTGRPPRPATTRQVN